MTTREVLIEARKAIANPNGWCQEQSRSGAAVCAERAIFDQAETVGEAHRALDAIPLPGEALFHFNDTHTHAEVLALFDRAIEAANR